MARNAVICCLQACPEGASCITLMLDTNSLNKVVIEMDFRQTTQPSNARPTPVAQPGPEHREVKPVSGGKTSRSWVRIFRGVLLIGIAILIAGIALAFTRWHTDNEYKYVNTASNKYQAVFLNNGQVYFGSIQNINDKYVRLVNIYYLTQTGDSAASNYSLVKLGCQQIHDPEDQMLINRDQVTFWENLQDDGKVVKSIKQFQQQNPKGPDCSQVSNQTQATSNAATQGSSTSTTNSSTDTTKK